MKLMPKEKDYAGKKYNMHQMAKSVQAMPQMDGMWGQYQMAPSPYTQVKNSWAWGKGYGMEGSKQGGRDEAFTHVS